MKLEDVIKVLREDNKKEFHVKDRPYLVAKARYVGYDNEDYEMAHELIFENTSISGPTTALLEWEWEEAGHNAIYVKGDNFEIL